MSRAERWACSNPVWRAFTGRAVIPWVAGRQVLQGEVLELGTGAGASAEGLLRRFPAIRLTATDVDPLMLAAAGRRLAKFGDRASTCHAEASRLDFEDSSFDVVVSLLMLHHVGAWAAALSETFRVLRPGGRIIGYDLVRSPLTKHLHSDDDPGHNAATSDELSQGLEACGFSSVDTHAALGGLVARFSAVKAITP